MSAIPSFLRAPTPFRGEERAPPYSAASEVSFVS